MEQISESIKQYNFISSEIESVYHRLNVKLGISDTVSYILYSLYEDKNVSQKDVVKMTGLSKQTVNSAVKKMISDGIFFPLSGERGESLVLTEKGERIMNEKISVIVHIENAVFSQWGDEKRKLFDKMNKEFLNLLKSEVESII